MKVLIYKKKNLIKTDYKHIKQAYYHVGTEVGMEVAHDDKLNKKIIT